MLLPTVSIRNRSNVKHDGSCAQSVPGMQGRGVCSRRGGWSAQLVAGTMRMVAGDDNTPR
jgi:hypothetical protein